MLGHCICDTTCAHPRSRASGCLRRTEWQHSTTVTSCDDTQTTEVISAYVASLSSSPPFPALQLTKYASKSSLNHVRHHDRAGLLNRLSWDAPFPYSAYQAPRDCPAGFSQAELAFPDLEAYAEQEYPTYRKLDEHGRGDFDKLLQVADTVRKLCDELRISILAVHPYVFPSLAGINH